jgi:hypothetical protein
MELSTRPGVARYYRTGGVEVDIAVADPSVTLIEIGDSFGFLLSERCDESDVDRRLVLNNVVWAKGEPHGGFFSRMLGGSSDLLHRELDRVELYRHAQGPFVAQDAATGLYLPNPSHDPYVVVFIELEEYHVLHEQIVAESFDDVLENLNVVLYNVPGISVGGDSLIGPGTYARGVRLELDNPLMRL